MTRKLHLLLTAFCRPSRLWLWCICLLLLHPFARASRPYGVTPRVPYEVRAVWLTTLMGLDWPHAPATDAASVSRQQADLCRMLDRLRDCGINTVLFQTRLRGTVAYPSAVEPWDGIFSGTPGKSPGYDPLAFAVKACHERGMECHAWVVAFPVCKASVAKRLGVRALPRTHPELCQLCGDAWMMDPGVPGTAPYLGRICSEIVRNYEVDGIHLDYIRYPEKGIPFNDARTYKRYGAGMPLHAWRSANVTRCVQAIHDSVKAVRPWVKLSCSPVGKYADLPRASSYGWNARDAVSQDAQAWLKQGLMDMLFPMMYFDGKHYYPFLADWKEADAGRLIVPGLGVYFLSPAEKDWPLLALRRQMSVARQVGTAGHAIFRVKYLLDNHKGVYDWLRNDLYSTRALVPPMVWCDSVPPAAPKVQKHFDNTRLTLTWQPVDDADGPVRYNVYRLDSLYGDVLLAQGLKECRYEKTLALPALKYSTYTVTAVDVWGNESESDR